MTNEEWLKSLSTEELAITIYSFTKLCSLEKRKKALKNIEIWLKQECEE